MPNISKKNTLILSLIFQAVYEGFLYDVNDETLGIDLRRIKFRETINYWKKSKLASFHPKIEDKLMRIFDLREGVD